MNLLIRQRLLWVLFGICALLVTARLTGIDVGSHGAGAAAAATQELVVRSAADTGKGSLREALQIANAARDRVRIRIAVERIVFEGALPPLANPAGMVLEGRKEGTRLIAANVRGAAVLDIASSDTSVAHLQVQGCGAAAVRVRAARVSLREITVADCDVGVEVLEEVEALSVQGSSFTGNRIGMHFAGASPGSTVTDNDFRSQRSAGLWLVRPTAARAAGRALHVLRNRFEGGPLAIVAGNASVLIEQNRVRGASEAGLYLIGAGAIARGNIIEAPGAQGIVAEDTTGVLVDSNVITGLTSHGILLRKSGNTVVRGNSITGCALGITFVQGNRGNPSSAVANTVVGATSGGIVIVGDSPAVIRNRVLEATGEPIRVEHLHQPGHPPVISHPLLQENQSTRAPRAGAPVTARTVQR